MEAIAVSLEDINKRPSPLMDERTAALVSLFESSNGEPFFFYPSIDEQKKFMSFTVKIHRAAERTGYKAKLRRFNNGKKIRVTPVPLEQEPTSERKFA